MFGGELKQLTQEMLYLMKSRNIAVPYRCMYYLSLLHFSPSREKFLMLKAKSENYSRKGEYFMAEVHLFILRIIKYNNEKKPSRMVKKVLVQLL